MKSNYVEVSRCWGEKRSQVKLLLAWMLEIECGGSVTIPLPTMKGSVNRLWRLLPLQVLMFIHSGWGLFLLSMPPPSGHALWVRLCGDVRGDKGLLYLVGSENKPPTHPLSGNTNSGETRLLYRGWENVQLYLPLSLVQPLNSPTCTTPFLWGLTILKGLWCSMTVWEGSDFPERSGVLCISSYVRVS